MKQEIDKLTAELANEIERLARIVLKEQGIDEQSSLYTDLKVELEGAKDGVVLSSFFNNYILYIENGRQPRTGKRPPIEALREWALSKGIPTDNSTLYAISYAIWRDGIAPRPILATLEERIATYIDNEFAEMLTETILSELNKLF